ncbi:MAG: CRTAC1 family protein [Cyclobacteriaceae bacterium]
MLRLFIVLSFLSILSTSCKQGGDSAYMIELLEKVAVQHSDFRNPYMHDLRIARYDSLAQAALEPDQQLDYQFRKSKELLNTGRSAEAAASFVELRNELLEFQPQFPAQVAPILKEVESFIAICYLRQGEQENCLLNHTSASCIIPIQPAGYHQLEEGSSQAIQAYTKILEKNDSALDARWLLNIAYMTLGDYPDKVPPQWLIPPNHFASDYPLRKFEDIAPALGLASEGLSGGTIVEDFNGDGFLDIVVTSWGLRDQMHYFQNQGDGTFSDKTAEAGFMGLISGLNMVHADYNNDGYADILVLRGAWLEEHGRHPNSLLRNNGPGPEGIPTFTDVTQETGLLSFMPTQTATWNDFNHDGWVDLFIGNETPLNKVYKFPSQLYLNRNGVFTEVAEMAGVKITEYIKGVTSGDFDNDGWADLYISTLEGQNFLFKNEGPQQDDIPHFQDVTEATGLLEDIKTFPTWFWDYNNDGWLDIFVSGYDVSDIGNVAAQVAAEYLNIPYKANMPRLYKNNGPGPSGLPSFTDVSQETNLHRITQAMGSNFGDLDNDGYLDMYLGTGDPDFRSIVPNLMFRNNQGESFQDVTTAGGFGHLQKGHAVAFADLNHDGDQDIFINMGGANYGDVYQNALFENPYSEEVDHNYWITLLLEGTQSNRLGIGARIKLIVTENGKQRTILRDVSSGGSFGANPYRQEIGLGKSSKIDTLEVKWPVSGQTQSFTNIKAEQFIKITEGHNEFTILEWKPFTFVMPMHHAHSESASLP